MEIGIQIKIESAPVKRPRPDTVQELRKWCKSWKMMMHGSCCCLIWDSRQLQRDSRQSQWTSSARKKYEIIFILLPAMYINRQITWAVSTCERTCRTRTFGIPCSSKSPHSDCNICSSFLFEAQLFVRAFHLKKFSCSFKGYALFCLS